MTLSQGYSLLHLTLDFLFALKTIFEGFGNHLVGKRYIFIVYLDKQNTLKKTTPTQQLLQTCVFVSLYEKVVL